MKKSQPSYDDTMRAKWAFMESIVRYYEKTCPVEALYHFERALLATYPLAWFEIRRK